MQAKTTIEVIDVHKSFKSYKDRAFQLKDAVVFRNFNKSEKREILKGISFSVKEGQALALIGKNGCGKSTTLKLLTRILRPDSGTIEIKGRVSSLIELGAGFHPDMSGRENIYINASIFGLSTKEVDERLEDIIRFSEIEEFIDDPVRTYSSGMYMRLAFAIAINVDADVLLIDEILAVGDAAFQAKCFNKLKALKAKGVTIVLVSHSMEQIKKLCDSVIWIENGRIREEGEVNEVCGHYAQAMEAARIERDRLEREQRGEKASITADTDSIDGEDKAHEVYEPDPNDKNGSCRFLTEQYCDGAVREGNWKARYTKIALCNNFGEPCVKFLNGDKIVIKLEYINYDPDHTYSFYVGITRDDDIRANESSTKRECGELMAVPARGMVSYVIDSNSLLAGKYTIGARIYGENSTICDEISKLISFEVFNVNEHEAGMFSMKHRWILNGEEIAKCGNMSVQDMEVRKPETSDEKPNNEKIQVERKKHSIKKLVIDVGIAAAICFVIIGCIAIYRKYDAGNQSNEFVRPVVDGNHAKKFTVKGEYADTLIETVDSDYYSVLELNGFPSLERMDAQEASEIMGGWQTFKRMEILGLNSDSFLTPELNYKKLYTDVYNTLDSRTYTKNIVFEGTKISELNELLETVDDAYISFANKQITFDETLMVKSNTHIDAFGVEFDMPKKLDKAIYALNVDNFIIDNFELVQDKYEWGFFAVGCEKWSLRNCTINNACGKAVVVLGSHKYFEISECTVDNSSNGAILINGDIADGAVYNNKVTNTKGTTNFAAGIVLGSVKITDYTTGYNPYIDDPISEHLEAPHNIVVMENYVYGSGSSGIYSDGSYCNYFIGNTSYLNDKEGMCLDQGTTGCYVSGNTIRQNGGRRRMTQAELEKDYVGEFGTMEDGSSPAKLPGISIDNAVYNIISGNLVTDNYGSGIKMVRSCARNIVMDNVISENNLGESNTFHFFGIELGYASKPDFETTSIDFDACYENIISRNVISGEHYAGIFIAEKCYINDFFDNVIMDATWWSMECLSDRFNSTANNLSGISSRGIDLSNANGGANIYPAEIN